MLPVLELTYCAENLGPLKKRKKKNNKSMTNLRMPGMKDTREVS